MNYEYIKGSLWSIDIWELVKLSMYDDIVLFCRLWPIWLGLTIFLCIVKLMLLALSAMNKGIKNDRS